VDNSSEDPPGPVRTPRPDISAALSVVAEWIKNAKEIVLGVIALAGAAIAAVLYFASDAELKKTRCLMEAHNTVAAYQDKVDLYELEMDTKRRIKNSIASQLDALQPTAKLEQVNQIGTLDQQIAIIQKQREKTQVDYDSAQRKLASDTCSERTSTASAAKDKE
jgi:hypothetical protein